MNNLRTPKFESKSIIKNKAQHWALNYSSGESDYPLQHLQELFRIIREIYKNKKRMEDDENEV